MKKNKTWRKLLHGGNMNCFDRGHTHLFKVLLLLFGALPLTAQTQLGEVIMGLGEYHHLGHTVSLSSDGRRVAVGTPYHAAGGVDAGQVAVYEYIEEDGVGRWVQLGQGLNGVAFDESGWSVSLSGDGSRVAIGAPNNSDYGDLKGRVQVYAYQVERRHWVQLGSDIVGKAPFDYAGEAIALSEDGKRLAVGSVFNDDQGENAGHVRIYTLDEPLGDWKPLGAAIEGTAPGGESGWSVALSADGSRVAIGAPKHTVDGRSVGQVRVLAYNAVDRMWQPLGAAIVGENEGDALGHAVSLSGTGDIVAISAPKHDEGGEDAGWVQVYGYVSRNDSMMWMPLGAAIVGREVGDEAGGSVSLTRDGRRIAIGSPDSDNERGQVYVYDYQLDSNGYYWQPFEEALWGTEAQGLFGYSVSLARDGTHLAVGAPFCTSSQGAYAGRTYIYALRLPMPSQP